jgi:hypothetical protein
MSTSQIPGQPPPPPPPQPGWGPSGPPPPRKRHRLRKLLLILTGVAAAFIGLVVGLAIGLSSAANHAANPNSASTPPATAPSSSQPAASAPSSAPAPASLAAPAATTAPTQAAPAQAAPATPAAPPADQILARFSGTGLGNTGTFIVPADGNWHLSWAYTNGSLFAGQPENFTVTEFGADGTVDNVLVNALAVGDGTPTATPVYSDNEAGQAVYFQVNTEDSNWSLVPVTGTS